MVVNLRKYTISATLDKSVILWFISAATLLRMARGDYPWRKSIPGTAFLCTQPREVTTQDGDKGQPRAS